MVFLKLASETHPSSSTHSCLIIAICAAGPPQASAPNLRKRTKMAASESWPSEGGSAVDTTAGFCLCDSEGALVGPGTADFCFRVTDESQALARRITSN